MKHLVKMNRAIENYNGFKGDSTIHKIVERIPDELVSELTGKQLALVMQAINKAYIDGRASTGAEMIDNNAVYINSLGKVIEWNEEGAEYETQTIDEPGCRVTKRIKVKDGILVPRFSE